MKFKNTYCLFIALLLNGLLCGQTLTAEDLKTLAYSKDSTSMSSIIKSKGFDVLYLTSFSTAYRSTQKIIHSDYDTLDYNYVHTIFRETNAVVSYTVLDSREAKSILKSFVKKMGFKRVRKIPFNPNATGKLYTSKNYPSLIYTEEIVMYKGIGQIVLTLINQKR